MIYVCELGQIKLNGVDLCVSMNWMQIRQWDKTGVSILAGEISLLGGLIMWLTTFPRIRRKKFELFFYTHHLYIIFVLFFIFHVGIAYAFISLPGFYLFTVDRFLRFLQSQRKVGLISARLLPCETVELNFSKTPGDEAATVNQFCRFFYCYILIMKKLVS